MKAFLAVCLVMASIPAMGAEYKLSPGTWQGVQAVSIVVAADGSQAVTAFGPITVTGGGGIIPPVVPPSPSGTITEATKAALATVPAYAERDQHRKAIAFGLNFLSQATANTDPAKARATVRQFSDAAVGASAQKWTTFWLTLDAKLDTLALTPASYTAAMKEIATALTADLPASDDGPKEHYGVESYGLDKEFLKQLIALLLPLILQLLGLG